MWDHRPDPNSSEDHALVAKAARMLLVALKFRPPPEREELALVRYALVEAARRAWDDARTFQATATPEERGLKP